MSETYPNGGTTIVAADLSNFESDHPYEDSYTHTWVYTHPTTAEALELTFDAQSEVEQDWDFLYIGDGAGNESGMTGPIPVGPYIVSGNVVQIRLVSDSSVSYYGFRVVGVQPTSAPPPPPAQIDAQVDDNAWIETPSGTITLPNGNAAGWLCVVTIAGAGILSTVTISGGSGAWEERQRLTANGVSGAVLVAQQAAAAPSLSLSISTTGLSEALIWATLLRGTIYPPDGNPIPIGLEHLYTAIDAIPADGSGLYAATIMTRSKNCLALIHAGALASDTDISSPITPGVWTYPWALASGSFLSGVAFTVPGLPTPGTYTPIFTGLNDAGVAHLGITVWIDIGAPPPEPSAAYWFLTMIN